MVLVRITLSTKTYQNEQLIVHHCRNPDNRMGIWIFLLLSGWIDPRVISDRCNSYYFSSDQEGVTLLVHSFWTIVQQDY
jgi:hypothetical protein